MGRGARQRKQVSQAEKTVRDWLGCWMNRMNNDVIAERMQLLDQVRGAGRARQFRHVETFVIELMICVNMVGSQQQGTTNRHGGAFRAGAVGQGAVTGP